MRIPQIFSIQDQDWALLWLWLSVEDPFPCWMINPEQGTGTEQPEQHLDIPTQPPWEMLLSCTQNLPSEPFFSGKSGKINRLWSTPWNPLQTASQVRLSTAWQDFNMTPMFKSEFFIYHRIRETKVSCLWFPGRKHFTDASGEFWALFKVICVFKDGSSREMISKELRGEELKLAHLLICVFLSSDLKEGKVSLFCRDRRNEIANKINQLWRKEDFFFSPIIRM